MSSRPAIDVQKWRACAARCRVWLCELLLWLMDHLGEGAIARAVRIGVRRELNDAERSLRGIVVLIALTRVSWAEIPGPRTFRPGSVKRTRSKADARHLMRIIRFRARTLRGRVQRLRDVIDALDAHIARMVKRLEAGFRQLGPILIVLLMLTHSQTRDERAPRDSS